MFFVRSDNASHQFSLANFGKSSCGTFMIYLNLFLWFCLEILIFTYMNVQNTPKIDVRLWEQS